MTLGPWTEQAQIDAGLTRAKSSEELAANVAAETGKHGVTPREIDFEDCFGSFKAESSVDPLTKSSPMLICIVTCSGSSLFAVC